MGVLDMLSSEFSQELYDAHTNTTYLFSPRAVTGATARAACQAAGASLPSLATPASQQVLVGSLLSRLPSYALRTSLDLRNMPGVPLNVMWHGLWVGLGEAGRSLVPPDTAAATLLDPGCAALGPQAVLLDPTLNTCCWMLAPSL